MPKQLLYQSKSAELFFLPESGILWLTWKEKVPSVTIQEVYEHLINEMFKLQVKNILLDVTRRGRATTADETWMLREFAPRLMKFFKEEIHLAYLIDAKHNEELQGESPNGSLESLSRLFSINYFLEEQAALHWLEAISVRAAY